MGEFLTTSHWNQTMEEWEDTKRATPINIRDALEITEEDLKGLQLLARGGWSRDGSSAVKKVLAALGARTK